MTTVKCLKVFKYQVTQLAKQKGASLFHCYCHGDIFRIATPNTVIDFDFTGFKGEEKIIQFMLIAILVLSAIIGVLLFNICC